MLTRTCHTYRVDIFVGSKREYESITDDEYYEMIKQVCQKFCDSVGLCVHIQKVDYVYTKGTESGIKVGLINYPRFPKSSKAIDRLARDLGDELLIHSRQKRITIITPAASYLLENSPCL